MLIAVASSDGEMVNEHFGKAERFWIFDVEESKQTLIMVRNVEPLSTGEKNHPFNPERLGAICDVIKDCERVYCTKIGERPQQELEKAGIVPVIYKDSISSISI